MSKLSDFLSQNNRLSAIDKKPQGLINGYPDYGYGMRYQEPEVKDPQRPKGTGYFGEVARPDGDGYSTEIGIGGDYGEIPSMVPGMSFSQMMQLLSMNDGEPLPKGVASLATSHAAWRKLNGKSPWAGINDEKTLLPVQNDNLVSPFWNR